MRDFTKAKDCTLSKSNKIFEAPPYEGICESALVTKLTLSRPFVSGSEVVRRICAGQSAKVF